MSTAMLDAALKYAELGYPVFPCGVGRKTPITAHGFLDATTETATIESWWRDAPFANPAIATAGLLVVDRDGQTNKWLADDERKLRDLEGSTQSRTPRRGWHHFFRQPAGANLRCTQSVLGPKVDTRADGGYVLLPPARVGRNSYLWVPGLELDGPPDRLDEPPAWLLELLKSPPKPESDQATERASDPTSFQDGNPIPDGQRNSTLAHLAGNMRRVGMALSEILPSLLIVNQRRCLPALRESEVRRIATSISRYAPDQVSTAVAERHYEQMFVEAIPDTAPVDPGAVPDDLLFVPGFIDEVMRYSLATAPYPEPVLAFGGALALLAVLAGRKVRDAMDNRSNIYLLALANSGVGKDHVRKVNARILHDAGMADCLGTSFASGEGIEDRLFVEPASLFQVDEFDGLLLRVGQSRDARHEQIVSVILQLYSTSASVYVMRAKAKHERAVIDQPCLCLFGTAVPKHFYESLSSRLTTNGFLARLLVLECRGRGTGQEVAMCEVPASIVEAARWWAIEARGHDGNLCDLHPNPRLVPQDDAATARFRTMREQADAAYAECERADDVAGMAIWARAYEKVRRLALLYACSANRFEPHIDGPAADWAGRFVEHQTRRMLYMTGVHACENEFDSKRKRLVDVLASWKREHGDEWMPFWRINRRLPWSKREHEELRDTLSEQRMVECRTAASGGRPGLMYRLAPKGAKPEAEP